MQALAGCFGIKKGDCVALVGSGGKTSLLFLLASQYRSAKVLVSTTTKMGRPPQGSYDVFCEAESLPLHRPGPGVCFAATKGPEGKLAALPAGVLAAAAPGYDYVLLEADGSRQLPLKGWAAHEPVVPSITTLTIGMLPLWPLGQPASAQLVHRLPLFCKLTSLEPGACIAPRHLAAVICPLQGKGLFTAAVGRQLLFFNQVENEESLRLAKEVIACLPPACKTGLGGIVAGSVRQNQGTLLFG